MRISRLISSVLLSCALMAGSGVAEARKGPRLQPDGNWTIKRVEDAPGSKFCAVARKFQPNTILTVAQNTELETSFALDFQAAHLDEDQVYRVAIDPGEGAERAFRVRPVSDQAMVIQLGQDDRFFSALERSGVLEVKINNQPLAFNVQDIKAGRIKLTTCLLDLRAPAAGKQVAQSPPRQVPENFDSPEPVEVYSLISPEAGPGPSAIAESARKQHSSHLNNGVSGDTHSRLFKLEAQNRSLESKVEALGLADSKLSNMRATVLELKAENRILRDQLDQSLSTDGKYKQAKDKLTELMMENERLRLAVADHKSEAGGQQELLQESLILLDALVRQRERHAEKRAGAGA